jgi:hypothetical protein
MTRVGIWYSSESGAERKEPLLSLSRIFVGVHEIYLLGVAIGTAF